MLSVLWPPMTEPGNLRSIGGLLNRFLRPYSRWLAAVVALNVLIGFALTLRPLVLAPALDAFAGKRARPAQRLADLTLNNVGPTLAGLLNLDAADPVKMGLQAAGLFLLVTVATATLSVAAQILVTNIRVTIHRDMLVALHAHLLTLPLGYFHKRRAGARDAAHQRRLARLGVLDVIVRQFLQSSAQMAFTLRRDVPDRRPLHPAILAMGTVHLGRDPGAQGPRLPAPRGLTDRRGDVGARLLETFGGHPGHQVLRGRASRVREMRIVAEAHRRAARWARIVGEIDSPIRMVADALVAASSWPSPSTP